MIDTVEIEITEIDEMRTEKEVVEITEITIAIEMTETETATEIEEIKIEDVAIREIATEKKETKIEELMMTDGRKEIRGIEEIAIATEIDLIDLTIGVEPAPEVDIVTLTGDDHLRRHHGQFDFISSIIGITILLSFGVIQFRFLMSFVSSFDPEVNCLTTGFGYH